MPLSGLWAELLSSHQPDVTCDQSAQKDGDTEGAWQLPAVESGQQVYQEHKLLSILIHRLRLLQKLNIPSSIALRSKSHPKASGKHEE